MNFDSKNIFTLSNMLSMLRLLLAVPIWFLIKENSVHQVNIDAFIVCVIASMTDVLDGYIARKRNEITEFGKIIDPLADKIAVGAVVIKLYLINLIPSYYLSIVVARDLLIFIGGIYTTRKIGKVLPSNILGKITVINIGVIILLILLNLNNNLAFNLLYVSSILLMFVSLVGYSIRANEFISRKKNEAI